MTTMPVPKGFIVTSGFGPRWGTTHWGTDFGLDGGSGGQPIYAVRDGLITRAGSASGFGKWITLDVDAQHGGGLATRRATHPVQAPGLGWFYLWF